MAFWHRQLFAASWAYKIQICSILVSNLCDNAALDLKHTQQKHWSDSSLYPTQLRWCPNSKKTSRQAKPPFGGGNSSVTLGQEESNYHKYASCSFLHGVENRSTCLHMIWIDLFWGLTCKFLLNQHPYRLIRTASLTAMLRAGRLLPWQAKLHWPNITSTRPMLAYGSILQAGLTGAFDVLLLLSSLLLSRFYASCKSLRRGLSAGNAWRNAGALICSSYKVLINMYNIHARVTLFNRNWSDFVYQQYLSEQW